jgi:hypothetical protein
MLNQPPSPSTNTPSSTEAIRITTHMTMEQSNVTQPLIPSLGTEDVESDYGDFNELDFTDITPTCEQGAIGTVTEAATNAATFDDNDLPPGWEQKLTKTPRRRTYYANHNTQMTTWADPRRQQYKEEAEADYKEEKQDQMEREELMARLVALDEKKRLRQGRRHRRERNMTPLGNLVRHVEDWDKTATTKSDS